MSIIYTKRPDQAMLHLHGELNKARSTLNPNLIYDWTEDIKIGDKCEKGSQLRPHIVWFEEVIDNDILNLAYTHALDADICIIVGTSMQVYLAANIPWWTKENCIIYYVDPVELNFKVPRDRKIYFYHIMMQPLELLRFSMILKNMPNLFYLIII